MMSHGEGRDVDTLPSIEAMLERQARFWEVRRRLAEEGGEPARRALAHLPEGPWVSVSRQLGSGGLEVARRIAERLGWQVFDREIVSTIARHTHTQEAVLSYLDERAIGPINDYIARVLDPGLPGQVPFLQEMVRVIWGLAKQGSSVIVGRGANWFLDPRYGLRLRVVAPRNLRVSRIAQARGLAPAEAERTVRLHDARQEEYIRQAFRESIDDPLGYDCVLNLGVLDVEAAVETVHAALRHKLR
jgi:cytidylate kinase